MSVTLVTNNGVTLSSAQTSTAVDDPGSTGLTLSDYVNADAQMTDYTDQVVGIESTIASNKTLVSAYQNMQSLLQSLQSAAQALAGPDGQSSSADVFAERTASLTSNSSTSASSILSVSVDAGTAEGSHSVVVQQIATAEQIASSDQASSSSALGYSGSLTIGAGSGLATVTVTSSMSLSDVASAINNATSTSGVSASIVEVSSSQYVLEITATDTGQSISMSDLSGGILTSLGLADSSGNAVDVIAQAQDAILTVDGITGITRSSNSISDVISGVTLDLTKADASSTIGISISADTDDIASAVSTFISAYNSWEAFVTENEATNSDGTAASTATLFGDGTLRDVSEAIDDALSGLVDNTSLGAIGISLTSSHTLTLDSASLSSALSDELSTVEGLFEVQADSSSANLELSYDSLGTYGGTLSFDITTASNDVISSATVTDVATGSSVAFGESGSVLTGASGGLAAGLSFSYSGSTTSSPVTVSVTRGIADQIYQIAHNYGNATNGVVASKITSLTSTDTTLNQNGISLLEEADNYFTTLLDQYAQMEAKITAANVTYEELKQMMESDDSSNS
jgi:flagellar hook-associated protein 2